MAFDPNELLTEATGIGSGLRVMSTSTQAKTFSGGTALIAKLTAVTLVAATGEWLVWDGGGVGELGEIRGFAWSDDIQLVSGSEVIGNVMMAGRVHYDDVLRINVTEGSFGTAGELDTALQGARDLGFIVEGMVGFG